MLNKMAIGERFFSCYPDLSRSDIGKIYGVCSNTVTGWRIKGTLSWTKLKYFSDSLAVSWDWILEGVGEKDSAKEARAPKTTRPKFPRAGINRRFLSLFPGMKYIDVAAEMGVTSSTVSEWKKNKSQVPWEKLEYAVNKFGVRWDWLIDGLEPKHREQRPQQSS